VAGKTTGVGVDAGARIPIGVDVGVEVAAKVGEGGIGVFVAAI
jgi:hypothetical protein